MVVRSSAGRVNIHIPRASTLPCSLVVIEVAKFEVPKTRRVNAFQKICVFPSLPADNDAHGAMSRQPSAWE